MSRYNRIFRALIGLAVLPLFLACDAGPTGPDYPDKQGDKEEEAKLIPEWNFIAVGETVRLRAVLPGRGNGIGDDGLDEAEKLEWESSDPAVAIVDAGEVHGLQAGDVLITAEFDGYRASARVTVRDRRTDEPDDDARYKPEVEGEAE